RHTRFSRDWSSDVCSSDLDHADRAGGVVLRVGRGGSSECGQAEDGTGEHGGLLILLLMREPILSGGFCAPDFIGSCAASGASLRSEERRVGEAWRCAWVG